MAAVQDSLESTVVELSEDALNAFADDISTMFEVGIECKQLASGVETIKAIRKNFKKVAAFHTVKAEGALSGDFTVAFDQGGLFILAGVIVMLPAKRIAEDAKRGSLEDAQGMADAVGEVGNLLVGSWDRIFREELDEHKHFTKTNTYVGVPWNSPQETIGLDKDGQYFHVTYELTLEDYPSFKCGVIFPQAMVGASAAPTTPSAEAEPAPAQEVQASAESEPEETAQAPAEPAPEPEPVDVVQAPAVPEPHPEPASEETTQAPSEVNEAPDEPGSAPGPAETDAPASAAETPEVPAENTVPVSATSEKNEIDQEEVDGKSVAPKDIPRSAGGQPGAFQAVASGGLVDILSLPAMEIMDETLVWGTPEESVQDIMGKMQQSDVGYAMVGRDGVLEGIVSKSNILGAISPYLRPVFAKWHTPAADATLDIKVKWIMTRPVRTVGPQATLGVVLQTMQQFGGRCLPVVEQPGKVLGVVTCFDVFRVLTRHEPFGMSGRPPQAPCLMI